MTKIWHPKHGFVYSGDNAEIQSYLDTGGEIYTKKHISPASPVTEPIKPKPEPVKQKDGRPEIRRTRHYDNK